MSVLNENTIIGASGAGGDYEIEQSLRFNDDDASYLSWTPAAAGNRKTWTWSGWVKRGNLSGGNQSIFRVNGSGDTGRTDVWFNASDYLYLAGSSTYFRITTQLFRDPSAWGHLVIAFDTTQSTATDRVKIYWNGVQITSFSTNNALSQNTDYGVNQASVSWDIGKGYGYLDGYMGEVNFIDGLALTPDSFGETGDYGEWKPLAYAGTYGTNGFYLPFEQDYTVEGFSTVVYEGTSAAQYIGGTGFSPDMTWFKVRSTAGNHQLYDTVRGASSRLVPNATTAESTTSNGFAGWQADGFSLDGGGGGGDANTNGRQYVAWNWDMGGTTASNTSGSITSSVRANQAYGQSIVSYTGTAPNGETVGHGLNEVPELIIVKNRTDASRNWRTYSETLGNTKYINLDATDAEGVYGSWNNTSPTTTVFSTSSSAAADTATNKLSDTFIAYCFHSVTGYSSFGSYSGTGASGNAITTGFAPAFVMIKRSDTANNWLVYDNTRSPTNPNGHILFANLSDTESVETSNNIVDFDSNGFTLDSSLAATNASGGTYIYMAFADTREYAYWLDQSGNNNDWTSEGGLTESDVMVDSPTNNFATLNPLSFLTDNKLQEGNLQINYETASHRANPSTIGMPSGKWYFEVLNKVDAGTATAVALGVGLQDASKAISYASGAGNYIYYAHNNFAKLYKDSVSQTTLSTDGSHNPNAGDIIGCAYDVDSGKLFVSLNNSWMALDGGFDGNPATGDNPSLTLDTDIDYLPFVGIFNNVATANFGSDSSFAGNKTPQGNQDSNGIGDFYYAPPTGFLALCTANLPEVDVIPSEHFNTVTYTGDGASTHAITGVGFTPDWLWAKQRNTTRSHRLLDSVRGNGVYLASDNTNSDASASGLFKTFDSDGFTLDAASALNQSGGTYVAWNWKAGGNAVSNTNGTITSQVSANVDAGFSIVSYTGTGAIAATIGHGLASAPTMIIRKDRDAAVNWVVYHQSMGTGNGNLALFLNTTSAQDGGQGYMNNTAPTASVFTQGDQSFVGVSGRDYISYCFHSVDGYSKVGSYTGNGSATDGTFVYCGFKPAYVMRKLTTSTGSWRVQDNARNFDNVANLTLLPNSSQAESTSGNEFDMLSNGFKCRATNADTNASGSTYIYIAFAENPFKHTNAR